MDKKENDNVYDNYIDSAILNDNEVQKNNYRNLIKNVH